MSGRRNNSLDGDTALELLAARPRRYLLSQLRDDGSAILDDVARQLAAEERDESPTAVDDDARERILVSLVHNHLPRLADHDVVEYDQRNGDIVPSEAFDDLVPVLERLEGLSDDDRLARSSYSR